MEYVIIGRESKEMEENKEEEMIDPEQFLEEIDDGLTHPGLMIILAFDLGLFISMLIDIINQYLIIQKR